MVVQLNFHFLSGKKGQKAYTVSPKTLRPLQNSLKALELQHDIFQKQISLDHTICEWQLSQRTANR